MAFLYIDSEGNERNRHSYSAGVEFDHCPYKYMLHRIMGWREKDSKAALLFGRALEDSIEFFHATGGKVGEEEFIRLWSMCKDKPLTYTKREVNWEGLMRSGREMMRLYAIRQPFLPIPMNTIFQRQFTKEVFPGHPKYGGIEFYAKLDMIANPEPNHPMLPQVQWNEVNGIVRPVIIDIKTSGIDLDSTRGIVAHDLQLRQYAWMRPTTWGWIDVAFLWFKKSPHGIKKGYSVTLLVDAERFKAGDEAVVASVEKDGRVYLVGNDIMLEEMNKAQGYREGTKELDTRKEAKECAALWRQENAVCVFKDDITRQRLQFSAGMVDPKSAEDAGAIAADQIVRIVNAWESNRWRNTFGVRFPHDDRRDGYFRAFVLRDNTFRDSMFEQKVEEDLSDYFDEPEEQE
jgi:PD-(D/E)XK nuclease superfamily